MLLKATIFMKENYLKIVRFKFIAFLNLWIFVDLSVRVLYTFNTFLQTQTKTKNIHILTRTRTLILSCHLSLELCSYSRQRTLIYSHAHTHTFIHTRLVLFHPKAMRSFVSVSLSANCFLCKSVIVPEEFMFCNTLECFPYCWLKEKTRLKCTTKKCMTRIFVIVMLLQKRIR